MGFGLLPYSHIVEHECATDKQKSSYYHRCDERDRRIASGERYITPTARRRNVRTVTDVRTFA
jgi:hypothetical protein